MHLDDNNRLYFMLLTDYLERFPVRLFARLYMCEGFFSPDFVVQFFASYLVLQSSR